MAASTTLQLIDTYLAETLTKVRFLIQSHKADPLPTKVFKAILAPKAIDGANLTQPQLDALNHIWEIEREAQTTLSGNLVEVFNSKLREIVKSAKRITFPAEPAYVNLIQGSTLQCLIRKGHITFQDALSLSQDDVQKIEVLGHKSLCDYLNSGHSLKEAFEEYAKIMQSHSPSKFV